MKFKGSMKSIYRFLQHLFVHEFVSIPGETENDFALALQRLHEAKIIHLESNQNVEIIDEEAVSQLARFVTVSPPTSFACLFLPIFSHSSEFMALFFGYCWPTKTSFPSYLRAPSLHTCKRKLQRLSKSRRAITVSLSSTMTSSKMHFTHFKNVKWLR